MPDTTSAAPSLLPCPFCGNTKNIAMANETHDQSGGYFIACPECGASTGLRYAIGEDPRALLAEQWNRRAQPASPAVKEPLTSEQLQRLHHIEEFGLFCSYDEFEQIARAIEFAHGIGIKKGGSNG